MKCSVKDCGCEGLYDENGYYYCDLHWAELNDGVCLKLFDGVMVEALTNFRGGLNW